MWCGGWDGGTQGLGVGRAIVCVAWEGKHTVCVALWWGCGACGGMQESHVEHAQKRKFHIETPALRTGGSGDDEPVRLHRRDVLPVAEAVQRGQVRARAFWVWVLMCWGV